MSQSFQERMLAVATHGPTEASSLSDVGRDNDDMPPPDAFSSPISGVVNCNAATVVKNYAKKLKIRGEPLTQLNTFLNVCPPFPCLFPAYIP
jgi:hypothetical protein